MCARSGDFNENDISIEKEKRQTKPDRIDVCYQMTALEIAYDPFYTTTLSRINH